MTYRPKNTDKLHRGIDLKANQTYYLHVNKEQNPDTALQLLEQKIDALVQVCQNLHEENQLLKNQHTELVQQRSALMDKTEKAKSRVESMISRLKLMEI